MAVAERRRTDEELAERVAAGDLDAFSALYDRYFPGVYDFALRTLHDREAAAGVVQQAFVEAWETLGKRHIETVKPWLYALAHKAAIDELRPRHPLLPRPAPEAVDGALPSYTEIDTSRLANAAPVLRDRALVELVWECAWALAPQEYALLDLHLRKGLTSDELAQNLGLSKATVDARISRVKDEIARGAEGGHASPLAILAALAPVPALPGVREAVWLDVVARTRNGATARGERRTVPKALIFATIAGVVAAAAAGGVFALRGGVDVHDPSAVWSPTHALNSGTSHASAVVRWTATADADAYSILWSHEEALPDKVAELPGSATRTTRVLSPGRWWFNLRTRGANGKWTSSVHLGPLVVLPLPETSIVDGPARASSDPTPAFRVSATRGGAFECSLDGAAFEGCPHGQDFARLRDGRHTVAIRLRDVFGSVDPTPAVWRWRIDTRAPDARILSTETDDDRARFEFKAGGPGAKFECRLDDAEFARCRSPKKYANLSEGTHRFQVAAIDAAGNRDPKPAERTWKVDTRAPETSIVSGPTGVVDSVTARFTFDTTEDEVTFECRLDGRAFRQCTSPKTFRGLASGAHTFRVRARDAAGNIDASPATRRWTVAVADLVAPKTTITSVATSGRKATIKFKSSEAGSTFECRLDGGAWAACSSPKAYSGLALGAHIVRVRARDGAGNIDATPAAANFTIP